MSRYNSRGMADTQEIRFTDEVVPPHRAIRRLPYEGRVLLQGIVLALLTDVLMAYFLEDVWRGYGLLVEAGLVQADIPFERATQPHAIFLVPGFQVAGTLPSRAFLVICMATILALLVVQWITRWIPHPVYAGLLLVSAVLGVGCLYFYFRGPLFPYSTLDFSRMWLLSETFMWFLTPFLFAFSYYTLPLRWSRRVLWPLVVLAFLFVSAAVRQAMFLVILHYGGVFWMPPMLCFGGLMLDFAFVVGLYSLGVTTAAHDLNEHWRVWK